MNRESNKRYLRDRGSIGDRVIEFAWGHNRGLGRLFETAPDNTLPYQQYHPPKNCKGAQTP